MMSSSSMSETDQAVETAGETKTTREIEMEMEMAEGSRGRDRVSLSDLPEECISAVAALTTPRDACRLSAVSSALKSAADSDSVWSRLLPPDINSILSRASEASPPPPPSSSLKELYFRLCNQPLLLDGGKMSFSLNSSGQKCYMLSPRALSIAWGDTPRYWRWTEVPDSRFLEVAELMSVCWFDIRGRIDVCLLSPSTLYAVYLVFTSTPDSRGFTEPTEVRVGLVDGESTERTIYLDRGGRGPAVNQGNAWRAPRHHRSVPFPIPIEFPRTDPGLEAQEDVPGDGRKRYPKVRGDGWLEIELGEFFSDGGRDSQMEVSVSEVELLHWKSGLIIQGIEIRPKETN